MIRALFVTACGATQELSTDGQLYYQLPMVEEFDGSAHGADALSPPRSVPVRLFRKTGRTVGMRHEYREVVPDAQAGGAFSNPHLRGALFVHMMQEHGLSLLDDQLDQIIALVLSGSTPDPSPDGKHL